MTRELAPALPDPLRSLLDGQHLERKEGETFILLTVGEEGWPRVALLSVGEVLAISPQEVRLALWPKSTTTENLRRMGVATLMAIHEGTAYYIELSASAMPDGARAPGSQARFVARVRRVLSDVVGYAELTSGVRFRLRSRPEVLEHWRQTVAALRG